MLFANIRKRRKQATKAARDLLAGLRERGIKPELEELSDPIVVRSVLWIMISGFDFLATETGPRGWGGRALVDASWVGGAGCEVGLSCYCLVALLVLA